MQYKSIVLMSLLSLIPFQTIYATGGVAAASSFDMYENSFKNRINGQKSKPITLLPLKTTEISTQTTRTDLTTENISTQPMSMKNIYSSFGAQEAMTVHPSIVRAQDNHSTHSNRLQSMPKSEPLSSARPYKSASKPHLFEIRLPKETINAIHKEDANAQMQRLFDNTDISSVTAARDRFLNVQKKLKPTRMQRMKRWILGGDTISIGGLTITSVGLAFKIIPTILKSLPLALAIL